MFERNVLIGVAVVGIAGWIWGALGDFENPGGLIFLVAVAYLLIAVIAYFVRRRRGEVR